ncbi:MAG: hypothetical protein KGI54_04060 [Pseudomonadota bacterium]|nr:hypothetical protein [Pseudomonadota bacterium]
MKTIKLKGKYVPGKGCVSNTWSQVTENCKSKFPEIESCVPGTFNVDVNLCSLDDEGKSWFKQFQLNVKKQDKQSDGYVYQSAKITKINEQEITCWLFCGELGANVLELLSCSRLSQKLNISHGDEVRLVIEED